MFSVPVLTVTSFHKGHRMSERKRDICCRLEGCSSCHIGLSKMSSHEQIANLITKFQSTFFCGIFWIKNEAINCFSKELVGHINVIYL